MNSLKALLRTWILDATLSFLPAKHGAFDPNSVGVTMLVCHQDVSMAIVTLKALFYQLGRELPVYIVGDPSLTVADQAVLKKFFSVTIETPTQTDRKMSHLLKKYPAVAEHRLTENIGSYKYKFDALLLHPFQRFIYLDADVLFMGRPKEVIAWLKNPQAPNYYIAHHPHFFEESFFPEFSLRRLLYKHLNIKMNAGFNSGLFLLNSKKVLSLSKLNELFKLYKEIAAIKSVTLEEGALSVLCAGPGFKCLPMDEYAVMAFYAEYLYALEHRDRLTMMHFAWETKNKYLSHAWQLMWRTHFFKST